MVLIRVTFRRPSAWQRDFSGHWRVDMPSRVARSICGVPFLLELNKIDFLEDDAQYNTQKAHHALKPKRKLTDHKRIGASAEQTFENSSMPDGNRDSSVIPLVAR